MSEHRATLQWKRTSPTFTYDTYNRAHTIDFPGGSQIEVSAAAAYKGDPKLTNPEEMLVAALSSCHMLTFLAIAAKRGYVVESYEDEAVGILAKNSAGKMAITRTTLCPRITFSGDKQPSPELLQELHHDAHEHCFIASSVVTEVVVSAVA